MQMLWSGGGGGFYFWFWQQTPSHILPGENGVSQPQTHREFHNLNLLLEKYGLSLTTTSTSPARKYKESEGEMTVSEDLSFFICPQESRSLSLGYSWATHLLLCEGKSSTSNKRIPTFRKMAWGTGSDSFFNYSELFHSPPRRDRIIFFIITFCAFTKG